jgi:serine/threonine-protein kinase
VSLSSETTADLAAELPEGAALEPTDAFPPGTRLGEWTIERFLGAGGMACVYHARHVATGADVALKVLRAEHASNFSTARRFMTEARAVHRIHHPNVVEIIGFVEDAELPFFAMQLLAGESLDRVRVHTGGRFPPHQAVGIAAQIADALVAAHEQGVLHRDLKPANVHLTVDAGALKVTLLDFGIAKIVDDDDEGVADLAGAAWEEETTGSGSILGTPQYMAPEQLAGRPATERTDLYALGLVLFETLAGEPRHARASFGETILQQLLAKPRSLGSPPGLPADVTALVAELLQVDPKDRPASAVQVRDRLRAIGDES